MSQDKILTLTMSATGQHESKRPVRRFRSRVCAGRRGLSSNFNTTFLIILAISVVIGSIVGYSFLVVKHEPIATTTATVSSSETKIGTTTITIVSDTSGQSQPYSTSSAQTTPLTSSTSGSTTVTTITSTTTSKESNSSITKTSDTASQSTTDQTTAQTTETVQTSSQTSATQTSTVQTNITTTSSVTMTTTQTNTTQPLLPNTIEVTGFVSTTGSGTSADSIQFVGGGKYYVSSVLNGTFSSFLPNGVTYLVTIDWNGAFSWQHGSNDRQLQVYDTQPTLSVVWQLQTPDSLVSVSGGVITTGSGTQPTQISFKSDHGEYREKMNADNYVIMLPNNDTYAVNIDWNGEYAWQTGSHSAGSFELNTTVSTVLNWNLETPDSLITLSGNLTASGIGTHVSSMLFLQANNTFTTGASLSGNHYAISLPNEANFRVIVGWAGEFNWQVGNVSAGDYSLNQTTGSSAAKNWNVQIPDAEVTVSGNVFTSGSGTAPEEILFSGVSGNFSAIVTKGEYSIVLPNTVKYEAKIFWTGLYSWQNGSVTYQLPVFAGAGSNMFSASWIVPTPNSTVVVSGSVTSQSGGTPIEIRFTSTNGQLTVATSVVSDRYSIVLPDDMNYTVVIYSSGLSSASNDGVFDLYAAPGVTEINANWIA